MLKSVPIFLFFILFSCSLGEETINFKHEIVLEVHAPAKQVWGLYRQLGISKLAAQKLNNIIQSVQVVAESGGVGTIVKYTFVPGNSSYTEAFTIIDDENMSKTVRVLDGGCLAIGCDLQLVEYDIIPNLKASCIIKSSISYHVKPEFKANLPKPDFQLYADFAQVAKNFFENPSGQQVIPSMN